MKCMKKECQADRAWLDKYRNSFTDYGEAIRLLEQAQRELDLLYAFAINNGAHECPDPLHREIKRFLDERKAHGNDRV